MSQSFPEIKLRINVPPARLREIYQSSNRGTGGPYSSYESNASSTPTDYAPPSQKVVALNDDELKKDDDELKKDLGQQIISEEDLILLKDDAVKVKLYLQQFTSNITSTTDKIKKYAIIVRNAITCSLK